MPAIITCKCPANTPAALFQEKTYGPNKRVANATAKKDKDFLEVRCTICNTTHRVHPSQYK